MWLRRNKRCQYGVLTITCGKAAVTKRRRPDGTRTWDVCGFHAAMLDRVRDRILRDEKILQKLEENGHVQLPFDRP